ncbi:MAG: T9SS type A sorting domain-containing protein [Cytophagaceae bacterium]
MNACKPLKVVGILFFYVLFFQVKAQNVTVQSGPNLLVPREYHQAMTLPNGNAIFIGGDDGNALNPTIYTSTEIYNVSANTIAAGPSMNKKRRQFCSEMLPNGDILVVSGKSASGFYTLSAEILNTTTMTWSFTDSIKLLHSIAPATTRMKDGRIMIAGGTTKTVEIFDPETNTWSNGPDMQYAHGEGMTLTLGADGNIYAIGGTGALTNGEVYNAATNKWDKTFSTYYSRAYHKTTMVDGYNVIISGCDPTVTTNNGRNYIETLSLTNFYKSYVYSSNQIIAHDAVMMDNGNILIYQLGGLLSPTNTNFVIEFNPSTVQLVKTQNFSVYGGFHSTIMKLSNGKLLAAGGDASAGLSALSTTQLFTQSAYSSCVVPSTNINITVNDPTSCLGKSASVTVNNLQTGIQYNYYVGGKYVGYFSESVNISSTITVDADKLAGGDNLFYVEIAKWGCPVVRASTSALIKRQIQNTNSVVIATANNTTQFCQGTNVPISVQSPLSTGTYNWSNSQQGNQISVNNSASVTARHVDNNGCYSRKSNVISLESVTQKYLVYYSMNICKTADPITLPLEHSIGYWTGAGISNGNIFTPSVAGPGSHILTYNYCNYTVTQTIHVGDFIKPTFSASNINLPVGDTLCSGSYINMTASGLYGTNYTMKFYYDNIYKAQNSTGYDFQYYFYAPSVEGYHTYTFKIYTNNWSVCGQDTVIINKTYYYETSKPVGTTTAIIQDTACVGSGFKIAVVNPVVGEYYSALYSYNNLEGKRVTTTIPKDTIYIYAPNTPHDPTTRRTINVVVSANRTCSNYSTVTSRSIYSVDTINKIIVGEYYQQDELIKPTLTSNFHSFQWDVKGNKTTGKTITPFSYSQVGDQTIQVISTSRYGCVDTATNILHITNKIQEPTQAQCTFKEDTELGMYNSPALSTVDNEGNSIRVAMKYLSSTPKEDNIMIYKVDKNGNKLWSIVSSQPQYSFKDRAMVANAIVCDENNNIYIAGNYAAKNITLQNISFSHTEYSENYYHAYIAKITPAGVVEWMYVSESTSASINVNNVQTVKHMTYNSGILYMIVAKGNYTNLRWRDNLGNTIPLSNSYNNYHSVVALDLTQKTLREISYIGNDAMSGYPANNAVSSDIISHVYQSFSYPNQGSAYYAIDIQNKITQINFSNNKLMIEGYMFGAIDFGTNRYTTNTATPKELVEFKIKLDVSTGVWSDYQTFASMKVENFDNLYYQNKWLTYDNQNNRYSNTLFKPIIYNAGYVSSSDVYYYQYGIKNSNDYTIDKEASIVKMHDANGNLKWAEIIKGFNITDISLSEDQTQLICVGKKSKGGEFILINSAYSISGGNNDDIAIIGLSATNGQLQWEMTLGADIKNDCPVFVEFADCNELRLVNKLFMNSDYQNLASDNIYYNNDAITANYYYDVTIPLSGLCNATNCALVTTTPISTATLSSSQNSKLSTVYPNPTAGEIQIKTLGQYNISNVRILNLSGVPVKTLTSIEKEEYRLDMQGLPSGVYLIEVGLDNQSRSIHKVVLVE